MAMSIVDTLKAAMTGQSAYALAKATGLSHTQVIRFLRGERDLRLETAAALCDHLGLELAPAAGKATRPTGSTSPGMEKGQPTRKPSKKTVSRNTTGTKSKGSK